MAEQYVMDLQTADRSQISLVGGKGAHLGELSRVDGARVPDGFCVTTDAFSRMMSEAPSLEERLDELSRCDRHDREGIRALSAVIRRVIQETGVPSDLEDPIRRAVARYGAQVGYAVRSSATAEDLSTASFAGQQDTYLNVFGAAAVVAQVRRCWASLFTERAVAYRMENGFGHREVRMAVVVQRMVFPEAAGVLFTADPVSGNRTVATVEATIGLGEALVSGMVSPDIFEVRDGEVSARSVAVKQRAVQPLPAGGTQCAAVDPRLQELPTLTDEQVVRLVRLGRRIEAHFGCPQDIEWCLADGEFQIVQSRSITTLFPVPDNSAEGKRVYVSVGHQQMMTDPMRPLGISVWQLCSLAPMYEAGGRLFVDVTAALASEEGRVALVKSLGRSDPLIGDALATALKHLEYEGMSSLPEATTGGIRPITGPAAIDTDAAIVTELVRRSQASLAALERDVAARSGPALFEFLLEVFEKQKRLLGDPLSLEVIMAGVDAVWWLNTRLREWLGEKNAADTLSLSVPDNVTAQMGLELMDVADAVRPYPEVGAFLREVEDEHFLDDLLEFAGGAEASEAIRSYLHRYGMRCVGEIDITRPRWSERPDALVPLILDHVRNSEPGAAERRFEEGRLKAAERERDVLSRLRALPDGERKADETKRMIDRVRTFAGYREYPKYDLISRFFVYKRALLKEGEQLVESQVLADRDDIFYLTFPELHEAVRTKQVDGDLIARRKEEFRSHHALTPPRVLTSDGEAVHGSYRREDVPAGALVGLPVSAGTVEGRARVVLDLASASLEVGDVLVTVFTDPSWSPVLAGITGLVTEVGGLMTHGAVIAREYGVPAVVGVEQATGMIRDGQRIRVHGADGYVEILD